MTRIEAYEVIAGGCRRKRVSEVLSKCNILIEDLNTAVGNVFYWLHDEVSYDHFEPMIKADWQEYTDAIYMVPCNIPNGLITRYRCTEKDNVYVLVASLRD